MGRAPLEVGQPVSEMDVKALKNNFQNWAAERAVGLKPSKAFERYVFEQVLKDYDPSDEDLDVGDLGDADDGGVDGLFFYVGGQLIGENTPMPQVAADVELHIIQAKYEDSFKEVAIQKLESFVKDMMSFSTPVSKFTYLNSKARDAMTNFREKYDSMLGKQHNFTVAFHYACIAADIPSQNNKIMQRAESLKASVKSVFSLSKPEFHPWAAGTILATINAPSKDSAVVRFSKLFSTSDQCTVCLVRLADFARSILSTEDGHLQTRFLEPNVRDYQGRGNSVNSGIRATLEKPVAGEEFRWLNNGITILASSCGYSGDKLTVVGPEIVNGLQTSHEVFNWYAANLSREGAGVNASKREVDDGERHILLKVIVLSDDESRSRIIKATNSQTKVSQLSLLSTEPIQQRIDDQLQRYGLFYDRKKGRCRRLKRPIKKVVGMRAMAQAVIAIMLRKPDEARGRPEQYVSNHAKDVFSDSIDADAYAACILIDRQVDEFLEASSGLTGDFQRDLRYYIGMFVVSAILQDGDPQPDEIAGSVSRMVSIDPSTMDQACAVCLEVYNQLGPSDQIAKNKEMTEAVQSKIAELW